MSTRSLPPRSHPISESRRPEIMWKSVLLSLALIQPLASASYAAECGTEVPSSLSPIVFAVLDGSQLQVLPAAEGGAVDIPQPVSLQRYCEADCADGTTIATACTGTCTAKDTDCDAGIQGTVTCNGVTQQTCTASCPHNEDPPQCRQPWPCNYQYHHASGCCIDQLQDPNYACPMVCD